MVLSISRVIRAWGMLGLLQALQALGKKIAEMLALAEKVLPRSEMVSQFHLMGHLVEQIRHVGPIRLHWMYPLESFFGYLKRSIKVRKIVEAAIMNRFNLGHVILSLRALMPDVSAPNQSAPNQSAETFRLKGRSREITLSASQILALRKCEAQYNPVYTSLRGWASREQNLKAESQLCKRPTSCSCEIFNWSSYVTPSGGKCYVSKPHIRSMCAHVLICTSSLFCFRVMCTVKTFIGVVWELDRKPRSTQYADDLWKIMNAMDKLLSCIFVWRKASFGFSRTILSD